MVKARVEVLHAAGLHLRPAGHLAEIGMKYSCEINYKHMDKMVNGKSLLSILSLGVKRGCTIEVECDGVDEEKALDEILEELHRNNIM